MKRLIFTIFTVTVMAVTSLAQSKDEQEILRINAGLEKAIVRNDIAPFEAAMADDYILSGTDGKISTRAEALKEISDEAAKPTYKLVSEVSDSVKVKIVGNVAYLTGNWTSVSMPLDDPRAEPHTDKGRFTSIYEKRGGKWLLVAEQFTEAQHDRKLMEQQIIRTSHLYDAAMKSRDKNAYERLLHADYVYTDEDGKFVSRADDIAHFASSDTVITTASTTDQKIQIVGNSAAIETGMYHVTGTSKGKPLDETGRYTTTWIWRDFRWQIAADHTSLVKK